MSCEFDANYQILHLLTTERYGRAEISKHALQVLNENAVARLIAWKRDLPAELDVDAAKDPQKCLPHVLTLK